MRNILVAGADKEVDRLISDCFPDAHAVTHVADQGEAVRILESRRYDYLFIDVALLSEANTESGCKKSLSPFKKIYPSLDVIVLAPAGRIRQLVTFVKAGASNYLTYPLDPEEVKYVVQSLGEQTIAQSELDYLRGKFWQTEMLDLIRTKSPVMAKVFENIRAVAPTKSTVLLTGETGVGKGVMARLIHLHSNRRTGPFISVHCGAIPDNLLESELFGHEKGSFTGAIKRKLGRFEIAKGGTIFLDEVGTITPSAQIKLLQVLQNGTFSRVGGEQMLETDARVIAASNVDLKAMAKEGLFRKDLFYRLNVFPVFIPPLRDRPEDLPELMDFFLQKLNTTYGKDIGMAADGLVEALAQYEWPGNIRELENLVERAYILEGTGVLTQDSFPSELFATLPSLTLSPESSAMTLAEFRQHAINEVERQYLQQVLSKNNGRINQTALAAGITTRQLNKLMHKYGIDKQDFKK